MSVFPQLRFIECHGTGTVKGDYAESTSIRNLVHGKRDKVLHIGSVKSNIGHAEAGSGETYSFF